MLKQVFPWLFLVALLCSGEAGAAAEDKRFQVELVEQDAAGLDVQSSLELAMPILWKRIVPRAQIDKALELKARTSMLLQFKPLKHGVRMVFNPDQVNGYLQRSGINMITEQPHWNLDVQAKGFGEQDDEFSQDLGHYAYAISDEYGFHLSSRGKVLKLQFSPATDANGEPIYHVELGGGLSSLMLTKVDMPSEGFASFQLQAFLHQVLMEIRDAYSSGQPATTSKAGEIIIEIQTGHALATQVMLEQALLKHPAVSAVVPTLLKKELRQYRLQLQDSNDGWLEAWFSQRGYTATRQANEGAVTWVVK